MDINLEYYKIFYYKMCIRDRNLTVSYEEQKAQWQERKKQQQKENAGIFKKLAPASLIYACLLYTSRCV